MPERSSTTPKDINQLAKFIVDSATDEELAARAISEGKDPAAVILGRRGGLKGGKARAASLSAKERSKIAKRAAQSRWRQADKNRSD